MTQHFHSEYVDGCYRCELGRDEAAIAEAERPCGRPHLTECPVVMFPGNDLRCTCDDSWCD